MGKAICYVAIVPSANFFIWLMFLFLLPKDNGARKPGSVAV